MTGQVTVQRGVGRRLCARLCPVEGVDHRDPGGPGAGQQRGHRRQQVLAPGDIGEVGQDRKVAHDSSLQLHGHHGAVFGGAVFVGTVTTCHVPRGGRRSYPAPGLDLPGRAMNFRTFVDQEKMCEYYRS